MYVHIRIFVSINAYFILQREGTWTIENWAMLQNQGKNRNCPSSQNHYLFFSTFKYLHLSLKYKDYYMLYFIICFVQPKTISKMFCICQDLVTGAPLQTRGCPRHDFSIVWEHRWLAYSVLGGLNNVLAREAWEREGTQAPTLHLLVNREPGSHVTHHKRRGEVSVVNPPSLEQGTGSPVWGQQVGPNKTLRLQIIDFFCWPPTSARGQFGAETNHFHKCFQGVLWSTGSEEY